MMKKLLSILSVLVFTSSLVSCTDKTNTEVSEPVSVAEVNEPAEPTLQECHSSIKLADNPAVTGFSLSAECAGNIKTNAQVEDIRIPENNIAGTVGMYVQISYENIKNPVISFTYDEKQLMGVPEENLIILHYYSDMQNDYDVTESVVDTENHTVSTEITEDGIYVLADIYQWYEYKGLDSSPYKHYTYELSEWEENYDTGDIMKLADRDWAMENAPDFHVSTAEELASVVWYANAMETTELNLTLENDIDLTGYEWKSMDWQYSGNDDIEFKGFVEGNNHTINGMTIHEEDCGYTVFLGFVQHTTMQNLNFTNADVSGDWSVGIAGGKVVDYESRNEWKNVHVSGKVTGNEYCGTVAGEGDYYFCVPFNDCTADVEVNGEPFEYLTYNEKEEADRISLQDTFTITLHDDGTITRDEHDGFINLGWVVVKNGGSCQLPLDAVENPVYAIDEAVAPYYTGRNPKPEGTYYIYLEARCNENEHTQRVSNIIEYHLEG